MARTFEQGWAARPFKEQFPHLSEKDAEFLDGINRAITDMILSELLTDAQANAIRAKKFPSLVSRVIARADKEPTQ